MMFIDYVNFVEVRIMLYYFSKKSFRDMLTYSNLYMIYTNIYTISNEEAFLEDFSEILKRIMTTCFLDTRYKEISSSCSNC